MSDPHLARLSSAQTTLDDLIERITSAADALHAEQEVGLAVDLYEVERSLRAAARRLEAVRRRMP